MTNSHKNLQEFLRFFAKLSGKEASKTRLGFYVFKHAELWTSRDLVSTDTVYSDIVSNSNGLNANENILLSIIDHLVTLSLMRTVKNRCRVW